MLEKLKVLDLTRVLAGPLCTMILGDMGAHVIKVERPEGGDETRGWGPPFDENGQSAYFLSVNRNKKSVAADLQSAEGRELVLRLLREADVVVDNFRVGTLERMGIAEAILARPEVVWCTITGFGPESRRPGYDYVIQAESGWMAVTGEADGQPMKTGFALADIITGKDAAIAILGALVARGRGGKPQRVYVSLIDSARAALINVAQNTLVTGREARRWGNAHPNLVPYQLFEAADRPIVVAVGSDAQWISCAHALGLQSMADDARYLTNAGRLEHRESLIADLGARLRTRPAHEWQLLLDDAGVPCGLVKSVLEALQETNASPLTGMPPSVPGSVRLAPPALDEHGPEIRRTGWSVFD
jgi:crotonobetainyl-CoA:carnitine CoA-transferase CaiB-like acyl-CoA transferase